MDHFLYKNEALHAEEQTIEELAERFGTPLYVYSAATLRRHVDVLRSAMGNIGHLICYAVKANNHPAVLRVLAESGCGADVVSAGEIRLARAAGMAAEHIVFSGVGKQAHEMEYALEEGIVQFNVESRPELEALSAVAVRMGKKAPVAFRVNPDVAAGTHHKISTGRKEDKFGIPASEAQDYYRLAASLPGIEITGISMHIGSQLTSLEPFRLAYRRMAELVGALRAEGHRLDLIDLGGGLGVPYEGGAAPPPLPEEYGWLIRETLQSAGGRIILEPGRLIVANAGILVSRVIYVKETATRRFVILDAGMNDLLRPAMYDARHEIVPVREASPDTPRLLYDVVGPVCETGDTFARDEELPELKAGDLVALRTAGAYGAVMASRYNARELPGQILVDGAEVREE